MDIYCIVVNRNLPVRLNYSIHIFGTQSNKAISHTKTFVEPQNAFHWSPSIAKHLLIPLVVLLLPLIEFHVVHDCQMSGIIDVVVAVFNLSRH